MRVVTIASGKGGVGKSTVSLNLALALAEQGHRVGLLDADLYGPDIPLMIGLTRQQRLRSWDLWRSSGPVRLDPVERFGIRVMSAGFLLGEDQALAFAAPLVQVVLHQLLTGVAWGELDELLVDLPPGTADLQQQLLRLVRPAGAVIVVGPKMSPISMPARSWTCWARPGSRSWVGWRTSLTWPARIAGSRSRSSRASLMSARSGLPGWPCWVGCPWTPRWPPPATAAGRCCWLIRPAARPRRCARSPAA
jgi:NUBPL iron-transfer P-loop NTPase